MSDTDIMDKLSDAVRAGSQVTFDGEFLEKTRVRPKLDKITLTYFNGVVSGFLVQLDGDHVAHFPLTREHRLAIAAALLAEEAA